MFDDVEKGMSQEQKSGSAFRRFVFGLAGCVVVLFGFLFMRQALYTRVLGVAWDPQYQRFVEDIDHSRWDRLLKKYVDDEGLVRYKAWHANEFDRNLLHEYLELLALTAVDSDGQLISRGNPGSSLTDHEKAYWINAYNALMIEGILSVYPTASVRQHLNPVGYNIQQHLKLMIGGRAWSLEDIRRDCLARFNDPRLRLAISNATKSCPVLLNRAWAAEDVDSLLDHCAADYLNSTSNVKLDKNNGLQLAKLLDEDNVNEFWQETGSWRSLSRLIHDEQVRQRIESEDTKLVFIPHNWSLNEKR